MHKSINLISEAIKLSYSDALICIIGKSKESLPSEYAGSIQNTILFGEYKGANCIENGFHFIVDCLAGQKTGFFLDQRENRKLLSHYANQRTVLNAFSYSGGFSIYALGQGAKKVYSVDVSKKALDLLNQNLVLNKFESLSYENICADVNDFLKNMDSDYFDLIILDPPAFAKSVAKRHTAVQAYKRLNLLAMKKIKRKGLLFTFSCSQVVDEQLFYNTIVSAGIESGRNIRVLHKLSQGPDHPVSLFHPEGNYLKGLVLIIDN
jgi:23S rRNA (cytosine1962-C5)-methyltransferase